MSTTPIADYALLSDCHSAALVSRDGSVDWLCFPRFDGPSVFARLLDDDAGHFSIRPTGEYTVTRAYRPESMVVETTFRTAAGTAVLVDALAIGRNERGHQLGAEAPAVLMRLIRALEGEVEFDIEFAPRDPNTGSCTRCSNRPPGESPARRRLPPHRVGFLGSSADRRRLDSPRDGERVRVRDVRDAAPLALS